jgi:hypothetical protein
MHINNYTQTLEHVVDSKPMLFTFGFKTYNNWLMQHPYSVSVENIFNGFYLDSKFYRTIPWYRLARLASQNIIPTLPPASSNSIQRTNQESLDLAVQCLVDCFEWGLPYSSYAAYQFGRSSTDVRRWIYKAIENNMLPPHLSASSDYHIN